MKSILKCSLIVFFLTGCVATSNYPDRWAPISEAKDDLENRILGSYECAGLGGDNGNSSINILNLLSYGTDITGKCDIFEITKAKDSLNFKFYKSKESLGAITFNKEKDYFVKENWIHFNEYRGFESEYVVLVGYFVINKSLAQSEDKELIIYFSGSMAGMAFILPTTSRDKFYAKYKKI